LFFVDITDVLLRYHLKNCVIYCSTCLLFVLITNDWLTSFCWPYVILSIQSIPASLSLFSVLTAELFFNANPGSTCDMPTRIPIVSLWLTQQPYHGDPPLNPAALQPHSP